MPKLTTDTAGMRQVHYRVPHALYTQLEALAARLYQPIPVLLRAAAVEYVARMQQAPTGSSGLSLQWPEEAACLTPDDTAQMSLPFNHLDPK